MYKHLSFNLPDGYDQQQLINELAAYYSIKKERSGPKNIAFYDTFDWRLFNKSFVLYESGNKLFLRELFNSAIICGAEMTSRPVFIWDFPDSELKKMLAPIIKMRALFKLAEIYSRSTPYRILNPDEKTVARLVYEEIRPSPETDAPVLNAQLWLQSVRGYPRYSQDLAKRFEDAGLEPNKKEDIYFKALEAAHKNPGSYSSKLNIQLSEKMRSDQAAKIILRFLLQVIKINQDNIEKALDTEFLHDFRVAIRRTRSALAQIKYVFPQDTTDRFKKDFAFAGKFSNQLRDLDVYLLKEDTYKAMLPDVLRDDIDPLFDYLRKKRSKALQETIKGLKSKTYVQILHDWEGFLNEPPQDSPTASNAGLPIIDLARKRTYKKYRNVVKTGNRIIENTDDKKLHALRIECKQLRYLMEFFSSLFSSKKINVLIEQLKNLQDYLGDYNDLCVQEAYLLNITGKLPAADQKSKKALVAIGSLIGTLDREKKIVKAAFAKTFRDYASPSNKISFRELFGPSQRPPVKRVA